MHKTTDEDWNPDRLVVLMLIMLFCTQKTTGEVWDPERLVILVQITLFCMHKTDKWDLGPIETWISGPKCAVLLAKTTDRGKDQ